MKKEADPHGVELSFTVLLRELHACCLFDSIDSSIDDSIRFDSIRFDSIRFYVPQLDTKLGKEIGKR